MRKNEFSRIDVKFLGRHFHPNGKDVRRLFPVTNYATFVETEIQNLADFKDTLVDLNGASSKYQKVGIHKLKKVNESQIDYYHFELGFVYRDQEKLETYDTENDTIEDILIDGTKYRHIRLHFTLVPTYNLIILDNKCHSSPTKVLLKELFAKSVNSTEFNSVGDVKENLRIKITPIPKDDFEQILNQKYRSLKEMSLMLAKPSKLKMSALPEDLDLEVENEKFAIVVESIMGTVFGVNKDQITIDELPIKSVRLSVKFDDQNGSGTLRSSAKNKAKDFLKEYRSSLFTEEASFKYPGSSGELEQALLNSAKLTSECAVNSIDYHDSEKMWEEQRKAFKQMKRKNLI